MDINKILSENFGFNKFLGPQENIINDVTIHGKNALVIMPTGGGKSLCYQVPALALKGGTIVISPLIALMQDQVSALRRKKIPASFINSTVSRRDRENRLADFVKGKLKLLYVTPERFRKKVFVEQIIQANISLLAVDEAHCIAEWGHDFRPDYSRIGEFREIIGNPVTIALTATATPEVQKEIVEKLHLDKNNLAIYHEGIRRKNLRLEAVEVYDDDQKLQLMLNVIEEMGGPGIIYFSLIKTLEKFAEMLDRKKIRNVIYHGKLENRRRKDIQRRFIDGNEPLILATNAFGMGIDKADIRFVMHAEVPSSVESYYQEIGRAGRDGKEALCMMIYNQQDLHTQMEFIKWSNPGANYYYRLFSILKNDSDKVNSNDIEFLREELSYKDRSDFRLETALSMLDRYGVTSGSVEENNIKVEAELPLQLEDEAYLAGKLKSDNMKLLEMVNYIRTEKCRPAHLLKTISALRTRLIVIIVIFAELMKMKNISNLSELKEFVNNNEAVMLYFSHDECNVCKVLKPKLVNFLAENFPKFQNVYVNIKESAEISGQYSIFAVPTILFYLNGQEVLRKSRNFGIEELGSESSVLTH